MVNKPKTRAQKTAHLKQMLAEYGGASPQENNSNVFVPPAKKKSRKKLFELKFFTDTKPKQTSILKTKSSKPAHKRVKWLNQINNPNPSVRIQNFDPSTRNDPFFLGTDMSMFNANPKNKVVHRPYAMYFESMRKSPQEATAKRKIKSQRRRKAKGKGSRKRKGRGRGSRKAKK